MKQKDLFAGSLYSGTSGLVTGLPNKSAFPPEYQLAPRLTYYASLFNSLEVNSIFYKMHRPETVKRWAAEVPEDFKFTFKFFKEITHHKERRIDKLLIEQFMHTVSNVGEKKGCLLVQFPPSLQFDLRYLKNLLTAIKRFDKREEWKLSVELRHPSWYLQPTYDLLASINACLVFQDIPKSKTPGHKPWTDFVYLRFHGPTGNYAGSYADELLIQYGKMVEGWLNDGKTVYVYFNNTIGEAFSNLLKLNRYLKRFIT